MSPRLEQQDEREAGWFGQCAKPPSLDDPQVVGVGRRAVEAIDAARTGAYGLFFYRWTEGAGAHVAFEWERVPFLHRRHAERSTDAFVELLGRLRHFVAC